MTEVQFAKQFLTTLDSKSVKFKPDHVFDPQTFQIRSPYTLPRLAHPPHPLPPKVSSADAVSNPRSAIPDSASSVIDLVIKSSRNPNFTLNLPSLPSTTLIATLKSHVQSLLTPGQASQIPLEKIKILYNKKPVPASKLTIQDATDGATGSVEFSAMIMGGAADPSPNVQTLNLNNETKAAEVQPTDDAPTSAVTAATKAAEADIANEQPTAQNEAVQPGELSGKALLQTSEFWDDLQGFLEQRLKSQDVAEEVRAVFQKAMQG